MGTGGSSARCAATTTPPDNWTDSTINARRVPLVGEIDEIFGWVEKKARLHRNVTAEEAGKTAVYLLSDLSGGVTGESIFVDCGYNTVGL